MLFSPVFAKPHPRRFVFPSSRDLCVLSVSALDCSFSLVASNLQFSIEHPDSVGTFNFQPSPCTKSFSCNTYASPRKCCKQKTYAQTKPFRCNTYKKRGVGNSSHFRKVSTVLATLTRISTKVLPFT